MTHNVTIHYSQGLYRYDGWRPPYTSDDVKRFKAEGYTIKWDDYAGYSVASVCFETAEEAVQFKLTHL